MSRQRKFSKAKRITRPGPFNHLGWLAGVLADPAITESQKQTARMLASMADRNGSVAVGVELNHRGT